jgi:hypothetical protein
MTARKYEKAPIVITLVNMGDGAPIRESGKGRRVASRTLLMTHGGSLMYLPVIRCRVLRTATRSVRKRSSSLPAGSAPLWPSLLMVLLDFLSL